MAFAVDKIGAKRVAIDSLESLFAAFSGRPALVRSELLWLFSWLEDRGLTTVITGERTEDILIRHAPSAPLRSSVPAPQTNARRTSARMTTVE